MTSSVRISRGVAALIALTLSACATEPDDPCRQYREWPTFYDMLVGEIPNLRLGDTAVVRTSFMTRNSTAVVDWTAVAGDVGFVTAAGMASTTQRAEKEYVVIKGLSVGNTHIQETVAGTNCTMTHYFGVGDTP